MTLSQEAVQQLLESVQSREECGGIATAKFYLKSVAPCLSGEGICPTEFFGAEGGQRWAKELSEADSRLTFSADDMTITKAKCGCDDCKAGKECPCKGKKKPEEKKGIIAEFDCVMTTPTVDRDGDIVVTKGLTFDERMPLLWHHMLVQPIGKFIKLVKHTDEVAIGRYGIIGTKMGEDVALLAEHGALRTSIGFIPKDIAPRETFKKGGETKVKNWHIKKAHVHENSMVSVPANQDVVLTQFSRKGLQDELVNQWAKSLYDARPVQGKGMELEDSPEELIDEIEDEMAVVEKSIDDMGEGELEEFIIKNCGTGSGGFKTGNRCQGGGGGSSSGGSGSGGSGAGKGSAKPKGGSLAKAKASVKRAEKAVSKSEASVKVLEKAVAKLEGIRKRNGSTKESPALKKAKSFLADAEKKLAAFESSVDNLEGASKAVAKGKSADEDTVVTKEIPEGITLEEYSYSISTHKMMSEVAGGSTTFVNKMYIPDIDLLEGSWEWCQVHLHRKLKSYMIGEGKCHEEDACMVAAMFDDHAIVACDHYTTGRGRSYADRLKTYRIAWEKEEGEPMWSGDIDDVEVKAVVIEKMLEGYKRATGGASLEDLAAIVVEKMITEEHDNEVIEKVAKGIEGAAGVVVTPEFDLDSLFG